MSISSPIPFLIKSIPYIVWMMASFSLMYLTLGIRVRKARAAFEKQLILQGMSKEDARRLSLGFESLKDDLVGSVKQSIFTRRKQ